MASAPVILHPVRCLLCLAILEARDVARHAGIPVYEPASEPGPEVSQCSA